MFMKRGRETETRKQDLPNKDPFTWAFYVSAFIPSVDG